MAESFYEREEQIRAELEQQKLDFADRESLILGERDMAEKARPWFFKPGVDPRQEIIFGLGRGVAGAVEEAGDGLNTIHTWLNEGWDAPHIVFGDEANNGWIGVERFSEMENPEDNIFGLIEAIGKTVRDSIPGTETISGNIIEEGSKFVAGWYAAGFLKPVQALRAGGLASTAAGYMLQGGVTDFFVYDGQEERASNFLREFDNPIFSNMVTEYLAADSTDSEMEGRMKNILEGAGLGLLADGIILSFRALRPVARLKEFKQRRAGIRADKKVLDDIDNTPVGGAEFETAEDFGFSIEEIAPDLITAETKSSPSAVFTLIEGSDGTRVLRGNTEQLKSSGMNLHVTSHAVHGDILQSRGFFIDKAVRGLGAGKKLLNEGMKAADSLGMNFASDSEVTEAAMRVWHSMSKQGKYAIHEFDSEFVNGAWHSKNGGPIFIATEWPTKGKITRVNAKKIKLDASVDAETIRSTVQRIVDEGGIEELVTALETKGKKGARAVLELSGNQQHYIDWDSFAADPEALLRFVKQIEDTFAEAIKASKGGTVSHAETVKRGLKLLEQQTGGKIAGDLFADLTKDGGLSARIFAGTQLLTESRAKLFQLSEVAQGGDEVAQAALMQHANLHFVLETNIIGSSSEVGRAMNALKIINEQRFSTSFNFDEMMRAAGQTGDVNKFAKQILAAGNNGVSAVLRKKLQTKPFDIILEILYGNLLSAPTTQLVNIIGNVGMFMYNYMTRAGALVPGALRRLRGGNGPTGLDEFKGANVGIYRGMSNALNLTFLAHLDDLFVGSGISRNWKHLTSGDLKQTILDNEKVGTFYKALLSGDPQTDIVTKLGEAGSARKHIAYTLPDRYLDKSFLSVTGELLKWGIINTVGKIVQLPGRLIMSFDEIFKSIAKDTERYANVYAQAASVQRRMGDPRIKTVDIAEEMMDVERHLEFDKFGQSGNAKFAIQTEKEGLDFARIQTFQSPLAGGKVMDAFGRFERFVNETKSLKLLAPFIRTTVNLGLQTIELTPVAQLLSRRFRGELKAGGVRQDRALAQMAMTFSATYMLYNKFAAGELRGTGSGNNSASLDGVDRYSIKLYGHWISFSRLDPFGAYIGFTTDMFELFENNDLSPEMESEGQSVFTGFMAAFSANFTNKTYLRGISELVEAMHYAEEGNAASFEKLVSSTLINALLPIVGSNYQRRRADGQEEFAKYIFGWKDDFISRIPKDSLLSSLTGISRHDLGTRMDPLGRPIEVKGNLGFDSRLWNPIDTSDESTLHLDRVLAELDFNISLPSRLISGVRLTGQQYSKYLFLRGQEVKVGTMTLIERLEHEVRRPIFNARSPEGKQDRINDLVRDYGRKAKKALLRQDETLGDAVRLAESLKNDALRLILKDSSNDDFSDLVEQNRDALNDILQP